MLAVLIQSTIESRRPLLIKAESMGPISHPILPLEANPKFVLFQRIDAPTAGRAEWARDTDLQC